MVLGVGFLNTNYQITPPKNLRLMERMKLYVLFPIINKNYKKTINTELVLLSNNQK